MTQLTLALLNKLNRSEKRNFLSHPSVRGASMTTLFVSLVACGGGDFESAVEDVVENVVEEIAQEVVGPIDIDGAGVAAEVSAAVDQLGLNDQALLTQAEAVVDQLDIDRDTFVDRAGGAINEVVPTPLDIPGLTPAPTPIPQEPALVPGPLDRSDWVLSASNNQRELGLAIDGNANTRWATRQSQRNGQWVVVDLASVQTFDSLTLESEASPGDFPRGYAIFVSDDGIDWGDAIVTGTDGGATTEISFPRVEARYVRIVQTGSTARLWWSIHELTIELSDQDIQLASQDRLQSGSTKS